MKQVLERRSLTIIESSNIQEAPKSPLVAKLDIRNEDLERDGILSDRRDDAE